MLMGIPRCLLAAVLNTIAQEPLRKFGPSLCQNDPCKKSFQFLGRLYKCGRSIIALSRRRPTVAVAVASS